MRTGLALAAVCLLAVLSCTAADKPVKVGLESYDARLEAYVSGEVETAPVDEEGTKAFPMAYREMGWLMHVNNGCSLKLKKSRQCPPVVRCNMDDKTCCSVAAAVNCRALLRGFGAQDTPQDALIMATLVGDLSKLVDLSEAGVDQPTISKRICEVKQKWAQYGARMDTLRIYQFPQPAGSSTFGATFEADGTTFLIFSWHLGFGQSSGNQGTLLYKGQAGMEVWAPFYAYYQAVESFGVLNHARQMGNSKYVLAGLSAGAGLSQFAALDLPGVRGVYLFGLEKMGFSGFQSMYDQLRGGVTHVWWNTLDGWPLVPVSSQQIADLFVTGLPTWVGANFVPLYALPNSLSQWWRIVPDQNGGTDQTSCQRITALTSPTLSQPCAGLATCVPNGIDHDYAQYFANIKLCVNSQDQCVQNLAIIA